MLATAVVGQEEDRLGLGLLVKVEEEQVELGQGSCETGIGWNPVV